MKTILPGETIGVLGGGQLGRMFVIAARRMGYRVHTLSPDLDTPTGQVSDLEIAADYEDLDAIRRFASNVSVVTFEFENVPVAAAEAAAAIVPVRPAGAVLHVAQHRTREKTFLQQVGIPLAPFRVVQTIEDLRQAVTEIGCPSILKTASSGYDGKGQVRITAPELAEKAWQSIGRHEAVLEGVVDFELELSVVAARSVTGEFAHYGTFENHHRNHILDWTVSPGRIPERTCQDAIEIARVVLEKLDVVGVLCVELFLARDGRLLVNEIAPRPHNSGHLTIDACVTDQFEQQLRAVCGLPLGSTAQYRPAAMANLLGDLWDNGTPNWAAVCARPDVKLHLYGKDAPRRGRKMGHMTALANDPASALKTILEARELLTSPTAR